MTNREQEQRYQAILQQVMLPRARERRTWHLILLADMVANWSDSVYGMLLWFGLLLVARIAIVKPDKARAIEEMVIHMAQRGQLAAKIDEEKLIELLNHVGVTEEKQRVKVTV